MLSQLLEPRKKQNYGADVAAFYRNRDEQDLTTPASRGICATLNRLSTEQDHQLTVLDVGCGTGRFFHALANTEHLVGLDPSPDMLAQAAAPAYGSFVSAKQVDLVCGDTQSVHFPPASFDLVISVGVFGNPVRLDLQVCHWFYEALRPGGTLFFTIADQEDAKYRACFAKSWKRRVVERLLPAFPSPVQHALEQRWETYFLSPHELRALMSRTAFQFWAVYKHVARFYCCEAFKAW